jgi:hypothetical protein
LFNLAVLAATWATARTRAHAAVDRNIFRSGELEIEVVFPIDWAVSEQASYPGVVLATAVDRSLGGRMTLAMDRLRSGERLRDLVERNRAVLGTLGFKTQRGTRADVTEPQAHPTGAVWMQLVSPDGRQLVRQAYRQLDPDGEVVFVITLAAPRESLQRYVRAFDDTVRGMARKKSARSAGEGSRPPAETEPANEPPGGVTPGTESP